MIKQRVHLSTPRKQKLLYSFQIAGHERLDGDGVAVLWGRLSFIQLSQLEPWDSGFSLYE